MVMWLVIILESVPGLRILVAVLGCHGLYVEMGLLVFTDYKPFLSRATLVDLKLVRRRFVVSHMRGY